MANSVPLPYPMYLVVLAGECLMGLLPRTMSQELWHEAAEAETVPQTGLYWTSSCCGKTGQCPSSSMAQRSYKN